MTHPGLLSVWGARALPRPRNADVPLLTSSDSETVHYHYGPKDLVTILFYIFITIILHAVVQEYILDVSEASRFRNQKRGRCVGRRSSPGRSSGPRHPQFHAPVGPVDWPSLTNFGLCPSHRLL